MKVLMLGDVYGSEGRLILQQELPSLITDQKIDFVVANGENVTHGKSITFKHFQALKSFGVDVITSGNHIFKNKAVLDYIASTPDLLKPLNMSSYTPGSGYVIVKKNDKKICVLNLMGTSFMDKANNPYEAMDAFLAQKLVYDLLLVDFHAEASAEKAAFAWNYDGQVTAVVGTHTHVQTADERLLPKGSAFITDLGMCGATDSIIGADPKNVIIKEKTGLPVVFEPATSIHQQLCGVIIEINDQTNQAMEIKRIFLKKTKN
ncbi:2',3'-cyclic-nucleotide 2'-phosphodiesterase [Mesoplasma sp. JKS002658]|uniref:TIGR00282 family metallophosphoesterase n=1 Tax=Mesoplasma whartonense TaxID=2878854 RepID=UPI002022B344|nr:MULTISPECIES: TIGR00282 family metallophosphoesterase [unclassified Mesoplasma]MCL8211491.1 2',3'-cyclic-nucleotide 2'-phosphodiesterase [Mesoplasma sp. JKS002664]MCL8211951.1 2',3'-cyclic-nucleotide 2'-phosphodiesterase [Mesoplasma sp. JKS002662]MCL8213571.1 2',3'-cyclic-nucleotide 2'-phosphodiesterase [Mesoplasma sp. JKS002660]MCL8213944.1 2',3'-cyclic-nucleotide 2'-phosphodiesterase [Mesoplasma sp. JKS002658]MCL8214910.1 2',3'-cyclic-nucleotide 2'-phosphodiesterase [Mesoplasma sp. JKS002